MRDLTAGTVSKSYALENLLPKHVAKAHLSGDIHFHDLDYHPFQPLTNCCLIDAKDMLENGFEIGNAHVTSLNQYKPHLHNLFKLSQTYQAQYGGCTVDRVDELLSTYAKLNAEHHREMAQQYVQPDKIESYVEQQVTKDIGDAIESLEYEINTLYTSNGQTPFVTLGFGLGTDELSRKIQQAILRTRIKGLGKDRMTAIFPKLVFN